LGWFVVCSADGAVADADAEVDIVVEE
jgi:hypothetical protein